MLFLLPAKSWLKNCKKLIVDRDYLILDCTDGQETKMSQFSNTVSMDNFCIPSKLLSEMAHEIGDDFIDLDNVETLEKNFFRGSKFITSVLATMRTYLSYENEINVFIVVRNKAFKYYRKRFVAEFCRVFPDAAPLLFIYSEDNKDKMKKALHKELTASNRTVLEKELAKKEKEMEKKQKPLKKKKKKKSKKNKNNGWGFVKDFELD